MVNTRRSESSSLAPENGQRYQTRHTETNETNRELGSSCDSINGEGEAVEGSAEEDSWSSQDCKASLLQVGERENRHRRNATAPNVTRVRELRSRFVCDKKKFSRLHLRATRRRHVQIFAAHKMRDIIDSDMEDCYTRYSKRESRLQRRAALSLRPIMQKSYKDNDSAPNCNSDSNESSIRVRRSTRTSANRHSQSWIGDSQMHKIGYPNPHQYSDDDSRDADVHKRKRTSKYHYGYEPKDHQDIANTSEKSRESQDKENKEDTGNRSTNGRPRRSVKLDDTALTQNTDTIKSENEDPEETKTEENAQEREEQDESIENGTEQQEEQASSEETEQEQRGPRTRRRKRKRSTSSSEMAVKSYSLRDRRPKPMPPIYSERLHSPRITRSRNMGRETRRFNGRRRGFNHLNVPSDSDSDSSDSEPHRNNTYKKQPKSPHSKNEQLRTGASAVLPIVPETLDPKITFKSVGGLKEHIQCLKEMVLLPMIYPEVFAQFQIQPSRGVLFHGPPGTGKTLLARALANECSFGSKKVSFFMRKGADLLSKWIGESERQLRLLFEQAAEKKPSIIFFDELDGLAPVRSSRQDQVHASIVSTLLALMDGLTNRGEIIVIGATNRIDAIDPALRRPGRFDRELFFPLPAQKEREEILRVYLSQWSHPPGDSLMSYLTENSSGYCGADLRAMCTEAVIQSFRRTYPQVYNSEHRLVLKPEDVKVGKIDFLRAKSVLVPASYRVSESVGNKLSSIVQPLLTSSLEQVMRLLEAAFPHGANPNLARVKLSANVRPAQILLSAESPNYGNTTYLAPALLHHMEHIHPYILDLAALHREGGRTPEEACIQIFHEAKRNVPSIIYIPNIDTFWGLVSETVLGIFTTQLQKIGANKPILLLATSDTRYSDLPETLRDVFSTYRNEVYEMHLPDEKSRMEFFKPLIMEACTRPPRPDRRQITEYPELERAATPPPPPITQDVAKKLYETEEGTLRELRIFLRDICKKLASNRLFFLFTKPVDTEEVPDYPTIIKEPMDLETMMTKVDFHRYECAKDFLGDIELICRNALEYNPARCSADKQIRHRACSLRDYAFALIKSEMDSDFEDKCLAIAQRRRQRNASVAQYLPPYLHTAKESKNTEEEKQEDIKEKDKDSETTLTNGVVSTRISPGRKRRISSWQRGCLKKRKKALNKSSANESQQQDHIEKTSSGPEEIQDDESSRDKDNEDENSKASSSTCDNTTPISEEMKEKEEVKCELNDLLSPSELLEDPLDFDDIDQALNETLSGDHVKLKISENHLKDVLQAATGVTKDKPLTSLLDLHFQLSRIVKKYLKIVDRTSLPAELLAEIKRYRKASHKQLDSQTTTSACSDTRSHSSLSLASDICVSTFN